MLHLHKKKQTKNKECAIQQYSEEQNYFKPCKFKNSLINLLHNYKKGNFMQKSNLKRGNRKNSFDNL